ncbi:hypothetical protein BC834DRAFT_669670 [Gloeopeniophorella convolvens]|nr:hypothetical protein BC834DRAFT_669670 [Gloeopeniophorella convolvens]
MRPGRGLIRIWQTTTAHKGEKPAVRQSLARSQTLAEAVHRTQIGSHPHRSSARHPRRTSSLPTCGLLDRRHDLGTTLSVPRPCGKIRYRSDHRPSPVRAPSIPPYPNPPGYSRRFKCGPRPDGRANLRAIAESSCCQLVSDTTTERRVWGATHLPIVEAPAPRLTVHIAQSRNGGAPCTYIMQQMHSVRQEEQQYRVQFVNLFSDRASSHRVVGDPRLYASVQASGRPGKPQDTGARRELHRSSIIVRGRDRS